MTYQIPNEVRHAGSLFFKGRYEEAFKIITNYEKTGPHSPRDQLSALILKGWILNNLLRFNESVKTGEVAYTLSKELGDNLSLFDALGFMSLVFLSGEFKKAREYALEAEEVLNNLSKNPNLDLTRQKADILYRKAWINFLTGDLDKALEDAIPCLELVKKTKDKMYESTVSILLGYVYHMRGELDIGLEYATKSLNIQKALKNRNGIAECLGLLGFIYYNKGDLNRALEACKEGLSFENLHSRTKVGVLRPLGHI